MSDTRCTAYTIDLGTGTPHQCLLDAGHEEFHWAGFLASQWTSPGGRVPEMPPEREIAALRRLLLRFKDRAEAREELNLGVRVARAHDALAAIAKGERIACLIPGEGSAHGPCEPRDPCLACAARVRVRAVEAERDQARNDVATLTRERDEARDLRERAHLAMDSMQRTAALHREAEERLWAEITEWRSALRAKPGETPAQAVRRLVSGYEANQKGLSATVADLRRERDEAHAEVERLRAEGGERG